MPEIVLRHGERYQVGDGPLFQKGKPQYVEDTIAEILLSREATDARGNVVSVFEDLTPKPEHEAKQDAPKAKAVPGKADPHKKLPADDILSGGGKLGSEQ